MMKEAPAVITVAALEVIVMPNGEIICAGKSLGWGRAAREVSDAGRGECVRVQWDSELYDTDLNGSQLIGYFEPAGWTWEALVARLLELSGLPRESGDKTTIELTGTFAGAPFSLYDYYEGRRFHIGGFPAEDAWFEGQPVDVRGLIAALTADVGEAPAGRVAA